MKNRICCKCGKVYDKKTKLWNGTIDKSKMESHTYCPECFQNAMYKIKRDNIKKQNKKSIADNRKICLKFDTGYATITETFYL